MTRLGQTIAAIVFTLTLSLPAAQAGQRQIPLDLDHKVYFPQLIRTTIARVSVASDGTQADQISSGGVSISNNGRFVAFTSWARNLVPDDTNQWGDVFVYDRQLGRVDRVSVGPAGAQAEAGDSLGASISSSGRYVAFSSRASGLVPGHTTAPFTLDLFLHDRLLVENRLVLAAVSHDAFRGGALPPKVVWSADERVLALLGPDGQIWAYELAAGSLSPMTVAPEGVIPNAPSWVKDFAAEGRWVAFTSSATNLVPGDANGTTDVFIHDRQTGLTTLESVATNGEQANGETRQASLSANGQILAFDNTATNLGAHDAQETRHVYVRDRSTGQTSLVSRAADGAPGDYHSFSPSISDDGRYVAFMSMAANLVPDDTNGLTDVFLHDRLTGKTILISTGLYGAPANGIAYAVEISGDGRVVVFSSEASNLVPGDTNNRTDIFAAAWQD